jgi:Tfp pilus assembly protein PilV
MRRKLTRFLRPKTPSVRKSKGVTITEVVIATSLLIIAIIPILKALTSAHVTSSTIERKTNSLMLAQAKLDEIKAHSIYNYGESFTETNSSLEGLYLCNVTDNSINTNLRQIQVSVGGDLNSNSTLDTDEIEVTLTTLIAKRW